MFKLVLLWSLSLCLAFLIPSLHLPANLHVEPSIAQIEQHLANNAFSLPVPHIARDPIALEASVSSTAKPLITKAEEAVSTSGRKASSGKLSVFGREKPQYGSSRTPNDIIVPHNRNSQTQGNGGSCHVFAMSQVVAALVFGETGKYLNPANYFADHIAARSSARAYNPTGTFMNTHIKDIEALRSNKRCWPLEFEGGLFTEDLKLLQMVGSELVGASPNNPFTQLIKASPNDYSSVLKSLNELKDTRNALLNPKIPFDITQQARLEKPVKEILSKTVFVRL
jgi:hypothetical protein